MLLDSRFIGQYYPPTTIVSFPTKKGRMQGIVQKLNKQEARVTVESNKSIWNVPYSIMEIEKETVRSQMTLNEIEDFAYKKLVEHELLNWNFGFDLAQNRGGICRFGRREITLSVTYCCNASREEIIDTVLHEIAHAMVGPGHQHDEVWRKTALSIGCNGEVCHSVNHGLDKWKGTCPCGQVWKRKKLMKKVRNGRCPKCDANITWEPII